MQTAPDVFILAATHFDEVALVTCLSGLRGEGITTVLITPTPGLLNGKRGITLRPDLSLAQISDFVVKDRQMVIIAGVPNRPRLPSLTLAPTNCCSTFWPLAAATIFDETICHFERGQVDIELKSDALLGMTHWTAAADGPHEVALTVDAPQFFDHYFSFF